MILVDTSLWIDHLRASNESLSRLLYENRVCMHSWIIGELACGNLNNRQEILELLQALPQLAPATENEVLSFIEMHQLMGIGIGYVDAHLLASAAIHSAQLWTRDKRLERVASPLRLAYAQNTH